MIETGEILQTMHMIQEENFDIRTITLGINLLDCSDQNPEVCAQRVYDRICYVARDLVKTGDQAILSGLINNDAMRAAADKAAVDNERYQAFLCYLRQLMDLYFDD